MRTFNSWEDTREELGFYTVFANIDTDIDVEQVDGIVEIKGKQYYYILD